MRIVAKLLEALGIAILAVGYISFLAGAERTILYYDFFIGIGVFFLGRYLEKRGQKTLSDIHQTH
jgi:Na+/phosphate symporter